MALSESARRAIADELRGAPHGARAETVARLATTLGVSAATVYRAARVGGTPRKRAPARPRYRQWVAAAVRIGQECHPDDPPPLDSLVAAGIESGVLPPEAAAMPIATAYRVARELGLVAKDRRTQRLDADYPNQALQFDGSTSKYLVVKRALGNGDWLLELHVKPTPARGYKNKPLGPDRTRVVYYGMWEMCTGYSLSRAVVARGENAFDEMAFLCWALEEKADRRIAFHGLADDVWFDQGNVFRSAAAGDLIERLDMNPNPGRPYNKERMGGVERSHRARWARFERELFLLRTPTIRLSELNDRLLESHVKENARRPSRTLVAGRVASRASAWVALVNARPADNPLRKIVPNAIETMAKEKTGAWIDANGIVRWEGGSFEVPQWHSMSVTLRRPLVEGPDRVVVEDPKSGERRIALPYERRPYGTVRAQPKSALEELAETATEFAGADLHRPGRAEADPRVVGIPARSAEARPLEDPLDAGRHPDIETALAAFRALYPHPLRPDHLALLVERIEEAGLAKGAVVDLAQGLTARTKRRAG